MIIFNGKITTSLGTYNSGHIQLYLLSYNDSFGFLALPQIYIDDSPVDELDRIQISDPFLTITRANIEIQVKSILQTRYSDVTFELV